MEKMIASVSYRIRYDEKLRMFSTYADIRGEEPTPFPIAYFYFKDDAKAFCTRYADEYLEVIVIDESGRDY